jgi:predicted nicotinamide N-methyase
MVRLVEHSTSGALVECAGGVRLQLDFRAPGPPAAALAPVAAPLAAAAPATAAAAARQGGRAADDSESDGEAAWAEPLFSGASWGAVLWDPALVLSQHVENASRADPAWLAGKTVLELGACHGLPALVSALHGATTVVLSDTAPYVETARATLALNRAALPAAARVEALELEWGPEGAAEFVRRYGRADLVLASDCVSTDVYGRRSWEALVGVLGHVCRGTALVCSVRRPGDGLDEFLALLASAMDKAGELHVEPAPELVPALTQRGPGAFVVYRFLARAPAPAPQ